ncbi:DNA cytosine methyltransferase [Promicromonospora sp. NFX87]|uniref:DNA cytosine methyltransferase n=1 Tax=Promicromonospora sp. NFX87 TaxID=3402691 RepID=UPI003AFA41BE
MTPAIALPLGRPLRAGGLFAGYGGLELALQLVFGAVDLAWVSEVDPAACRILSTRFPGVPNLGDVTAVDWAAAAPIDLLAGGSPCQDLSQAGKRAGMTEGTRSNLWVAMREAIAITRPRLVIWENVRGAYSACAQSEVDRELGSCPRCVDPDTSARHAPHLRALGRVLGDLSSLGYDAAWTGLRAADVGAPHGRFRVFVLAWDTRTADPAWMGWGAAAADAEDHRLQGSLAGRPAPLRTGTAGAAAAAGHSDRAARDERWEPGTGEAPAGRTSADAGRPDGAPVALLPTPRATDGTKGGPNQRGSSGDLMLPSAVTLLPTPKASNNENRQSADRYGPNLGTALGTTPGWDDRPVFGTYTPAIERWEPILGRLAPAPTEPTGRGGAQRLAPRFVEWMQGLPAGWVTDTDTTRNEQLQALGNGVVPQQAAHALHRLLAVRASVLPATSVASPRDMAA